MYVLRLIYLNVYTAVTHDEYKFLKIHFCKKLSYIRSYASISSNPLIQNFIPIAFEIE